MHKNIAVLEWLQAHTIASDMLVFMSRTAPYKSKEN